MVSLWLGGDGATSLQMTQCTGNRNFEVQEFMTDLTREKGRTMELSVVREKLFGQSKSGVNKE